MSETQLVRLVSGEEVLAKIESVDGGVKLTKPYLIIPTQGRGIALMPWCPYSNIQSEGDFAIRQNYVRQWSCQRT